MSQVVSKYEDGMNFWKVNTQFKAVEPFKSLYKDDKSKDKVDSSYILWAIALCFDTDSQFFGMVETDRKEMVAKDFLEEAGFFEKESNFILIEAYKKLTDTQARRQLRIWSEKMDEKSRFMAELKYDAKTWKMLDEMLKSNKDLYTEYSRIEKLILSEGSGDSVEGGSEESLSEKGAFTENATKR